MHIIPLEHTNPQHTRAVVALVLQSTLDYGSLEADPRLLLWRAGGGRWAAAVGSDGVLQGIVVVVALDDQPADCLLWLEVLPSAQRQGIGTALLRWAQAAARQPLVLHSVASARTFYERLLGQGEAGVFHRVA
jgi:GNAT superfamily N-acetyltransferase